MSNTYILLKDLPNVPAGTEITWNDTSTWSGGPYKGGRYGVWDMPSEKSCTQIWTCEDVENNPSWFKLKEQVEEKRIEVTHLLYREHHTDGEVYEIKFNRMLRSGFGEAVKRAIEREINNDQIIHPIDFAKWIYDGKWWHPENIKANEVWSIEKLYGMFCLSIAPPTPEPQDSKEDKGWEIRVGDSVFFDVSKLDETSGVKTVEVSGNVRSKFPDMVTVEYFDPIDGQPVKRNFELKDLKKQPKEKPNPLFVTENGVGAYIGNVYYKVTILEGCWKADEIVMRKELANPPSYFKYFSTKEAADTWVLENKPCLSVSDVCNFLHKEFVFDSIEFENLKQLANHKINNKQ